MPTFANPWFLLLLPTLPALAWLWQYRKRAVMTFPTASGFQDLPVGRAIIVERGTMVLRLGGLLLLILAMAGPRWPDEGSRIPTEGISIAIVLDASHSMSEMDFRWGDQMLSRFDGVRRVFRLLVEGGAGLHGEVFAGRPHDLVSLVVFATRPETVCPLTLDHAALLKMLDAEEPRTVVTEATTNPGDALAWSLHALQKAPTRRKVIVFLTDGESNVPPPALKPRQAAQLAGNLHIPVYAIDAAPEEELGDSTKAKDSLREVAKLTNGAYFRATDGAALSHALHAIDQIERDAIRTFRYRRYDEGYPWFAFAALACWLALVGLDATWWRTIP